MESGPHRLGQDARRIPAAIDALYQAYEAGQPVEGVTRVYLGPLKAPAVDIHTNLEEPLAEIAEVARELGYEPAPISVAVRTGDSMSWERQLMIRRPPNLLVTTPESRAGAVRRDPALLVFKPSERLTGPREAAAVDEMQPSAARRSAPA